MSEIGHSLDGFIIKGFEPGALADAPALDLASIRLLDTPITDRTGVPLGSDRDPEASEGIDFAYKPCPYEGSPSRYPDGKPHETQMSGLEQRRLTDSYPEIRRLLLVVRSAYLQGNKPGSDEPLTVRDGLAILTTMQYLPHYLVNRATNTVAAQGELPQHLIVASNCASGSIAALGAYSLGEMAVPIPPAQEVMGASEAMGTMVGEKTVCAAAPGLILDFLETLRSGNPKVKLEDGTATNGLWPVEEFQNTMLFGIQMENVHRLGADIKRLDAECLMALDEYDPAVHSFAHLAVFMDRFKKLLDEQSDALRVHTTLLNLSLGRKPEVSEEGIKAFIFGKNALNVRSIKKARQLVLNNIAT